MGPCDSIIEQDDLKISRTVLVLAELVSYGAATYEVVENYLEDSKQNSNFTNGFHTDHLGHFV